MSMASEEEGEGSAELIARNPGDEAPSNRDALAEISP